MNRFLTISQTIDVDLLQNKSLKLSIKHLFTDIYFMSCKCDPITALSTLVLMVVDTCALGHNHDYLCCCTSVHTAQIFLYCTPGHHCPYNTVHVYCALPGVTIVQQFNWPKFIWIQPSSSTMPQSRLGNYHQTYDTTTHSLGQTFKFCTVML